MADIVPVDLPVNLMITTAWYTVVTKPKDVLIYHSTTGDINPFTWGELGKNDSLTTAAVRRVCSFLCLICCVCREYSAELPEEDAVREGSPSPIQHCTAQQLTRTRLLGLLWPPRTRLHGRLHSQTLRRKAIVSYPFRLVSKLTTGSLRHIGHASLLAK